MHRIMDLCINNATTGKLKFSIHLIAKSIQTNKKIHKFICVCSFQVLESLNPMTQSSLLSFAELFSFMLGEAGRPVTRGRVVPPIEPCDMLTVFDKAIKEVELGQKMLNKIPEQQQDPLAICRALVSALHLACLLARLLDDEDCESVIKNQVLKALHNLVSLKVSVMINIKISCENDILLLKLIGFVYFSIIVDCY